MKKIIQIDLTAIIIIFFCSNTAFADAVDCADAAMQSMSVITYRQECDGGDKPILYSRSMASAGNFCGPDAEYRAMVAVGSGDRYTFATCGSGVGAYYNRVSTVVEAYCNVNGNPSPYSQETVTITYAVYCTNPDPVICDCAPDPEKCFKVTAAAACKMVNIDENIVAFQVQECDCNSGEDTGGVEICGDPDAYEAISADYTGASGVMVDYPTASCSLSQAEKDQLCESMEGAGTCQALDSTDTDGDGVPDNQDYCATPPEDINNVDILGCTKQGNGDDDGDGVPDEFDKCVTPPGSIVDAFGCQITPDPDMDTDGDGMPDDQDSCPSVAGNGADGCAVPEDQKDSDGDGIPDGEDTDIPGDGDSDGPLIKGVIEWLRKVNSGIRDVNGNLKGLGGKLDGIGDSLDGIGDSLDGIEESLDTSDVNTDVPGEQEVDGTLPGDYVPIDLEENFLTEIYDGLLNNNPFISTIRGTVLSTSGNCSINQSISVMGRSVTLNFSVCDYDLFPFRTAILLLSTLTAFFIVFRKG